MLNYNNNLNIFYAADEVAQNMFYYSPIGLPEVAPPGMSFNDCAGYTAGAASVLDNLDENECSIIASSSPGQQTWLYNDVTEELIVSYSANNASTTVYISCDSSSDYAYFYVIGQSGPSAYAYRMASRYVCLSWTSMCPPCLYNGVSLTSLRVPQDYALVSYFSNYEIVFNFCGPLVTPFTNNCRTPSAVCNVYNGNKDVTSFGSNPAISGIWNATGEVFTVSYLSPTINKKTWRTDIQLFCGNLSFPQLITENTVDNLIEISMTAPIICSFL